MSEASQEPQLFPRRCGSFMSSLLKHLTMQEQPKS